MSSLIAICQVVLEKKICHQYIFVFRYFLLLEKGMALHNVFLNKPKFPLSKWFWRKRFQNIVNVFLLFQCHLPFEKGMGLHLDKLESPLPKNTLCKFG